MRSNEPPQVAVNVSSFVTKCSIFKEEEDEIKELDSYIDSTFEAKTLQPNLDQVEKRHRGKQAEHSRYCITPLATEGDVKIKRGIFRSFAKIIKTSPVAQGLLKSNLTEANF